MASRMIDIPVGEQCAVSRPRKYWNGNGKQTFWAREYSLLILCSHLRFSSSNQSYFIHENPRKFYSQKLNPFVPILLSSKFYCWDSILAINKNDLHGEVNFRKNKSTKIGHFEEIIGWKVTQSGFFTQFFLI